MATFEERFEPYHRKLQENIELVRGIFRFAREKGLVSKLYSHTGTYYPLDRLETEDGEIYLGLDLSDSHALGTHRTNLAHMRLLHEISGGNVDIPRIYMRLDHMLGIVSEDMTNGMLYEVIGEVPTKDQLEPCVLKLFDGEDETSLVKTTFNVRMGTRSVRRPVVDLDHLDVAPEWHDKYMEYRELYDEHPLFILREPNPA